jgi:tetratricopeptide (TPR) repeat protein
VKPILPLLLLLSAPALAAPSDPTRYAACIELAPRDPSRALELAYAWRLEGNTGVAARHCLAIAQMHARHHDAALKSYEAAGQASEDAKDGQAIAIWRQAADAALIIGRPAEATRFLTRALARPGDAELSPRAEADLRLARAEALVDAGKPADAMADLDAATQLVPDGVSGWLLKATLHRRQQDLPAAEAALLKAAALAPDAPDVELEAGNIAAAQGNMDLARQAWEAAVVDGADTPAGKSAAAALGRAGFALPEVPAAPKLTEGLAEGLTTGQEPAIPR